MRALPIAAAVLFACAAPPRSESIRLGGTSYDVEVISTRAERAAAPEKKGGANAFAPFLLCETRSRFLHYHSKNVGRALDVVFLDSGWTIVDAQTLEEGRDEGITSKKEASAALFLASGEWAASGAKVGDAAGVSEAVKALKPEERWAVTFKDRDPKAATVFVELALTSAQRGRGLMHRERMSENDGMLFKYSGESAHSYWMKNTRVPLSIAYVRADGVIDTIIETMKPLDEGSYPSKGKVMFALEVNEGWFKKRGIAEGDVMAVPKEVREMAADD